jgi:uncharacterized protein (TIGR03435 family)
MRRSPRRTDRSFTMAFRPQSRIAAFLLAAALTAQERTTPAAPRFETVSIRPVPANAPPVMRDSDFTPVLPGGQYIHSRAELFSMISLAYSVDNPSVQLVGLPNWAKDQSFAIAAKPAEGFPALSLAENLEQVRLMMRAMLEDRFRLQLHTETRQGPILKLEVAKGGLKVKEAEAPVPPAKEGLVGAAVGNDRGRIIGNKSTMAGLARALTIFIKRPVVDQTGLKGYYDFDVKWSAPETADRQPPSPGLGPDGIGLLISTLQNQLGLYLTNTAGPVKYWVVDHVTPPTDN